MEYTITQFDTGKIAICGYDAKELALFAEACRRQGITEDELHQFCLCSEAGVIRMRQLAEDELKETLNRIYGYNQKKEETTP